MKTLLLSLFFSTIMLLSQAQIREFQASGLQDELLHYNARPQSIFKVPQSQILKAKYPAIDMHMHAKDLLAISGGNLESAATELLKNMDECGIEKTILFCETGETFDKYAAAFGKYPNRIELWCGFDFTGSDPSSTIAEVERCVKLGAKGVGEISNKGAGLRGLNLHIDDPFMDPILEKLADLKMPISVHSGDPQWMYEKMDSTNDLLFESYNFRLDNKKNILDLAGVVATLERALKKHPRTIFVACHFLNQTYNLAELGRMLDKYPNLYADVSQREAYVAAIPKFAKQFIEKYADRLVYGTDHDSGYSLSMYRTTFRIWESLDEHFYAWDVSNTPWALYGLGLSDATLKSYIVITHYGF